MPPQLTYGVRTSHIIDLTSDDGDEERPRAKRSQSILPNQQTSSPIAQRIMADSLQKSEGNQRRNKANTGKARTSAPGEAHNIQQQIARRTSDLAMQNYHQAKAAPGAPKATIDAPQLRLSESTSFPGNVRETFLTDPNSLAEQASIASSRSASISAHTHVSTPRADRDMHSPSSRSSPDEVNSSSIQKGKDISAMFDIIQVDSDSDNDIGTLSRSGEHSSSTTRLECQGRTTRKRSLSNVVDDERPSKRATGVAESPTASTLGPDRPPLDPESIPVAPYRKAFTEEDGWNIIYLKEVIGYSFDVMREGYFPHRSKGTLSTHYCKNLKYWGQLPARYGALRLDNEKRAFRNRTSHVPTVPVTAFAAASPRADMEIHGPQPVIRRKRAEKQSAMLSESNLVPVPDNDDAVDMSQGRPSPHDVTNLLRAQRQPYISFEERQSLRDGFSQRLLRSDTKWDGTLAHVDLQYEELAAVEQAIHWRLQNTLIPSHPSILRRIQVAIVDVCDDVLHSIAFRAKQDGRLRSRKFSHIQAFLRDARAGQCNTTACLEVAHLTPNSLEARSTDRYVLDSIRERELGRSSASGGQSLSRAIPRKMKRRMYDTLGVTLSYTGMAHDVNTLAWDPEGNRFAAGSVCTTDPSSMQYNRPRNLFLGSVEHKTLRELPDHHTLRQRTETGANSTHAMHTTQDPRLFSTISSVAFSPSGNWLYSVGYDNFLRVWDARGQENENLCVLALEHKAKIDVMSVSPVENVVATGSKHHRGKSAIKILRHTDDPRDTIRTNASMLSVGSSRAAERPEFEIHPSSLKFEPRYGEYLLGGFSSDARDNESSPQAGDVCVWDVATGTLQKVVAHAKNCFDCSWSPLHLGQFAVGHIAGSGVNRGCRSEIKIYSYRQGYYSSIFDLECPARDMNDVVFCPYDENYIASGCTDGTVYVWDLRNPDEILYRMRHGTPLMERPDDVARELVDEGVRFLAWGSERERLYSGASDGVVRVWDVTKPKDEAFVRNAASLNSGVMCGSFTNDYSKLLLGEVNGTINVLEVGRDDYVKADVGDFRVINVPEKVHPQTYADEESGIAAAEALLADETLILRPMGGLPLRQAVQGPGYVKSTFTDTAPDAPFLREQAERFQQELAKVSSDPCQITSCCERPRLTQEEMGDSGRSSDRIPSNLRAARPLEDTKLHAGFGKCTQCNRLARPRTNLESDTAGGRIGLLCEMCDFTCFRCGQPAAVSEEADTIWCCACDREWTVDALGYTLRKQRGASTLMDLDKTLAPHSRATTYDSQDEVDDLTNYYHSLWIDRPPSPPL